MLSSARSQPAWRWPPCHLERLVPWGKRGLTRLEVAHQLCPCGSSASPHDVPVGTCGPSAWRGGGQGGGHNCCYAVRTWGGFLNEVPRRRPDQGASVLRQFGDHSGSCRSEKLGWAPFGGCPCLTHVHTYERTHSGTQTLLCKEGENVEGQRSAQRVSAWTWSRVSERRILPDSQDLVGNLPWGSPAPVVVSQAPDVLKQSVCTGAS